MDETIPLDHPLHPASQVIRWYDLIHSSGYSTQDKVTITIMCVFSPVFVPVSLPHGAMDLSASVIVAFPVQVHLLICIFAVV